MPPSERGENFLLKISAFIETKDNSNLTSRENAERGTHEKVSYLLEFPARNVFRV